MCQSPFCERHSIGADHGIVQARRRREGDRRRRHSSQTGRENHGQAGVKGGGNSHRSLPVRPVHQGRLRVRRAHVAVDHGFGPRSHRHFDRRDWGVRSDLQERDVRGTLPDGERRSDPPLREMFLWGSINIFVGRRDGSHPTHPPRGGRGARRPPHADAVRTRATPSSGCSAREVARERIAFAYLDDVYAVCRPDRVGAIFAILEQELQAHAEIRLHLGKTQVWNRGGVTPDGVDELQRRARLLKPEAVVWKGDPQLPEEQQGVRVLGVPIGRGEFVRVFLEKKNKDHETLFQRIPWLNDPQSAWLLLLMCASTRANFWLISVHPDLTDAFALQHDANVWTCLDTILGSPSAPGMAKVLASLSFSVGGLGLSSAHRNRESAHWASWAVCLRMVHDRHPDVAETMIAQLEVGTVTCFEGVQRCRRLVEDAGLEVPSWRELAETPAARVEDPEPGKPKYGWQQKATTVVEQSFVHTQVWPLLNGPTRALLRSQHGPFASAPFTALPTSRVTRFDAQPFRLLLCRRLHLPLPLTLRTCRCGRRLDMFGHHRATCAEAGVLGKRGFPLECAAAQICREAGARVATNVWVRNMDLGEFNALDGRRLEVVADGLSLWRGAQLAIDTTLVSPLSRATGQLQEGPPTTTELHCRGREEGRRPRTRSCPEKVVGHTWLY